MLLREELVLPHRWTCLQCYGDVLLVVREHFEEVDLALYGVPTGRIHHYRSLRKICELHLVQGVHWVHALDDRGRVPEEVPLEAHYGHAEGNRSRGADQLVELQRCGGLIDEEVLRILTLELEDVGECQRMEQLEIEDQHLWSELDHGGQGTGRRELRMYTMHHSLIGCGGVLVHIRTTTIKASQVSIKLLYVHLAIMTCLGTMHRDLLSKILLQLPNR